MRSAMVCVNVTSNAALQARGWHTRQPYNFNFTTTVSLLIAIVTPLFKIRRRMLLSKQRLAAYSQLGSEHQVSLSWTHPWWEVFCDWYFPIHSQNIHQNDFVLYQNHLQSTLQDATRLWYGSRSWTYLYTKSDLTAVVATWNVEYTGIDRKLDG